MFLKRDRPETDDFVIIKYLGSKEKYWVESLAFNWNIIYNLSF